MAGKASLGNEWVGSDEVESGKWKKQKQRNRRVLRVKEMMDAMDWCRVVFDRDSRKISLQLYNIKKSTMIVGNILYKLI